MHPRAHLLLTTLAALAARRLGTPAAWFWAGGVLADADHLLWHASRTGRVDPLAAWTHFSGEGAGERPAGALVLHRWPVIAVGAALAPVAPWAGAFALGLAFHRLLDDLAERYGPRHYAPSVLRRRGLHEAVFDCAGRRCEACGAAGVKLEAHHRVQREAGGKDTLENLVALCVPCHRAAHALLDPEAGTNSNGGFS